MPFEPLGSFDPVALEKRVLERWRDHDVFHESLRRRAGGPEWVFYEGPPTANGRPGIHHVWARLFKDLYPRYHTMRGRYVARKAGWDCHGLPVEVEVEKELGFSGKTQIEAFGIEEFNRRCRESVQRYVGDFEALTERIGMWLDVADAYWTMSDDFIESVWWHVRSMWDAGHIYEGHKVVPYCGRCGTALSSHELGQPGAYRDVTEDSVYVRFPLADDDADLLVWTTTPWTLVSNVGAAIGPNVDYVRVAVPAGGRDVVMARDRVAAVLGDDARVRGPVAASELVGRAYERPFGWLELPGDAPRVVADEFVTVDDGSGIVHLAPAFGEVDREVAEREGLPMLNPVGPAAEFDASVPEVAGAFVKEADARLVELLAESGRLLAVERYTHSYPHCWRCGTPLIYWAKPTWFARTSAHKADLLRENDGVEWHPGHIKAGRFGDWLENNVDWALSRDRYWGTPLPVWRCSSCGTDRCFGSRGELADAAGRDLSTLDLHRPYVDDVEITCSCGGTARRVEPVLDAWFDSGSMPAAQFHFPFENREVFERRFPADFICEAIDQTRGWFYSLLAVNTLVFGRAPYRNVVCLALVVDADGQKMSKSRGNVIDPWTVLDTRGADALRWNFLSTGSPWTPKRVSLDGIDESTRRFLVTLWNTVSFFVTYANLDGWSPPRTAEPEGAGGADGDRAGGSLRGPSHVMDRWVLSRLNATVREVTAALDGFDALRGAQAIEAFVDDVSNWYVRRSRPRFWRSADDQAHATLHRCLATTVLLLAPYCPFLADAVHRVLTGSDESVHLADWPEVEASSIDPALEAEMADARHLVSLGREARNQVKLGVRQPLSRALVVLPREGGRAGLSSAVAAEVADELNVKRLDAVTDIEGLLEYTVLPNFRVLGPRLGARLPALQRALATVDGAAVARAVEGGGTYPIDLGDGEPVELGPDDVQIRASSHDEMALARDEGFAVGLDTTLDHGLRLEGLARSLVRALNEHRKAAGLDIADRIEVDLTAGGTLAEAAVSHGDWIASEVLATAWRVSSTGAPGAPGEAAAAGEPLVVDDQEARVTIRRPGA